MVSEKQMAVEVETAQEGPLVRAGLASALIPVCPAERAGLSLAVAAGRLRPAMSELNGGVRGGGYPPCRPTR